MIPLPIKRYRNRKLYNTVSKRYITLEEIRELICCGNDIVVTDLTSGQDITTSILTQVIMGQGRIGESALSNGVLTGLIRARADTLEMLRNHLPNLQNLRDYLRALDIPTREDINMLAAQLETLRCAIDEIEIKDDEKENGRG
jgi:polyhydroxyalkanoate synthesis repressor PhaR